MIKTLFGHLIALFIGAMLGYWLLTPAVSIKQPAAVGLISQLAGEQKDRASDDQQLLIQTQQKEIERLTQALSEQQNLFEQKLAKNNSELTETSKPQDELAPTLKTMNMKTFENSIKTSFTEQFKGVVIEAEGQRLEAIKNSFSGVTEKNEWSSQYENSIANFLANKDINGDHYVQSLSCNTSVCRLEVNTNDSENWNRLYAEMTNESWYESITIQEKSDYPGNVIYYLPSLKN